MKKSILPVLFTLFMLFVGAGVALANPTSIIDVSNLKPDVSMVGTLGAAICTGLLGIWGVRKVIKLINRS
ncbi:hypothetical protein [Desulfomicrobium orale]|uniref:Uncharacterized protein n=1 Tax=Desulfomicrobium orale DSM 12838 TaxID=888061 RepID=A0A109W6F5_9BACT|nr:hypothetical protein [Desulfomicrobium orale]AMD93560.1 hypothetical protein AXF15_10910 [Desulfomicrobium orale DSM 12838]